MKKLLIFLGALAAYGTDCTISDTVRTPFGGYFAGRIVVALNGPGSAQPLYSGSQTLTGWQTTIEVPASANGAVAVTLVCTDTITPSGTSYSARYQPTSGSPWSETWTPTTGTTTIRAIRATTVPTPTTTFQPSQIVPGSNGQVLTTTAGATAWGSVPACSTCVVTSGSYADPAWLTSLAGSKVSGAVASATSATTATTATTATALAANGTNCAAGTFPLGVDASGNSESCTALPTTISGTANQITASASTGAVTLSLPTTITGLTSVTSTGFTGALAGNASTATALASILTNGAILKGQGTGIPTTSILSETPLTSTYDSTARTVAAITDGGLARIVKSRPSTESKRIVIYGSSVAAGSGASTYANSWAGIFSTAMTAKGYTVYNPSIGGNSTAALIARFWTDVAPVSPDFVILASGFPNDGYDQATYLANMHRLIKMIESIGAIPVIFGQYGDNTVDATILRKKQEIYAYFDKTGLLIADMFGSVADPATGYWLPGVYTDSLHPNDTGHAIMAANIPYTWFDNALTARAAQRSKTASALTLSNTSTTQSPILVTLDRPAPSWTIAGWFRDGGTVGRAYFGVTNTEGNIVRGRNASGLIDFAGAPGVIINSSVNGQGNEWHHIAVTHQGNTKTNSLYVDGALIGTVVGGSTAVTATAFAFLGRSDTNTLNMIGGSIAMPLVYRAALTANDIKQIYSGSIPIRSLEWASSLSQLPTAGMIRNEADTSVSGIVTSAADWTGPAPFITDRALGKAAAFGLAVYDQGTIGISQITVRPGANQSTTPTMAWLNSGGTTVSSVDSNGYANFARLGVGITPTNPLHIYSAPGSDTNAYFEGNGAYLKLNGRVGYSHVEFQNNGTATWKIGQDGVTRLQFFNGGVEKASMATDGTIAAPGFTGDLTGNASTATALASTVASGRLWIGQGTGVPTSDSSASWDSSIGRATFRAASNANSVPLILSAPVGGTSTVMFQADNAAKTGTIGVDSGGNMVLSHTTSGSMYFDHYSEVIFRSVSASYATRAKLVSTGNLLIGTTTDLGYGLHAANKGTNGNLLVFDPTATTGTTKAVFRGGAGQSGNIFEINRVDGSIAGGVYAKLLGSNDVQFGLLSSGGSQGVALHGGGLQAGLSASIQFGLGTVTGVNTTTFDASLSRASAGVLQVGDGGANSNGAILAKTHTWAAGTEGTCNSTNRGQVVMVQSGAGVADTLRVCRKDAADAYAWTALY